MMENFNLSPEPHESVMHAQYNAMARQCVLYRERPLDATSTVGCDGVTRRREIHNSLYLLNQRAAQPVATGFAIQLDPHGIYVAPQGNSAKLTPSGQAMLQFLTKSYGAPHVEMMHAAGIVKRTLAEQQMAPRL